MDPAFVLRGFLAGAVATFSMLPAEVVAFRRFGLRGVFEWHEILASVSRGRPRSEFRAAIVFSLHLVAGGVTGLLFAVAIYLLRFDVSLVLQGLGLGALLWLLTLALHEKITGVHPWKSDMALGPVGASLVGHLLYGAALGSLMAFAP